MLIHSPRSRVTQIKGANAKSVQHSLRSEHDASFVARLQATARIPDDRLAWQNNFRKVGPLHFCSGHLIGQEVGEDPPSAKLFGCAFVPFPDEIHLDPVSHSDHAFFSAFLNVETLCQGWLS